MAKCSACDKNVKEADKKICSSCHDTYHYQCLRITVENFYKESKRYKDTWKCPRCKSMERRGDNSNTPVGGAPHAAAASGSTSGRSTPSGSVTMEDTNISAQIENLRDHIQHKLEAMKSEILQEINARMNNLEDTVQTLTAQNKELTNKTLTLETEISRLREDHLALKESVEHLERKDVELQESISEHQEKELKYEETIKDLQQESSFLLCKVEDLEQKNRSCNLEVRGIPETQGEDLTKHLDNICAFLDIKIDKSDLYTSFRSGRKGSKPRAVVYMFKSIISRDDVLKSAKDYNKNCKAPDERLKTSHIGIPGEPVPIYVSEHLSPKLKYLLSKCRQAKSSLGYEYCWVLNGRIFMKKDSDQKTIWIKDENMLMNL